MMNSFCCSMRDCLQTFRTKYELKSHQLLKHSDFWKCRPNASIRLNAIVNNNTDSNKTNDNIVTNELLSTINRLTKQSECEQQMMANAKIEEQCVSNWHEFDNTNDSSNLNSKPIDNTTTDCANYRKINQISRANKRLKAASKRSQRFACNGCPKTFIYRSSLRRHAKNNGCKNYRIYGQKPKIFSCDYCTKIFANMSSVYKHQIRHHFDKIKRNNDSERYACDECGQRFKFQYYVVKHKMSVHRKTYQPIDDYESDAKGCENLLEKFSSDRVRQLAANIIGNTADNDVYRNKKTGKTKRLSLKKAVIEKNSDQMDKSGNARIKNRMDILRRIQWVKSIKQNYTNESLRRGDRFYTLTTANNQRYYACVECGKRFVFSGLAATHHRRAHAKQRYFCDVADCPFYSFDKFHISIHRSESHSDNNCLEHANRKLDLVISDSKSDCFNDVSSDVVVDNDVNNEEFIGLPFPDSDILDLIAQ